MRLLVARHGETQFNAEHRYLGALDPELNMRGELQAIALRSALPEKLDTVVCSPLRRALRTAEIVCQGRELVPVVCEAFRERNVGVFEGLTQQEARFRFPELWAQNVTRQWHAAPTSGESIAAVVDRVSSGLTSLAEKHAGDVVALVAHGFVAKVIRAVSFAGFADFFEWQLANGDVFEVALQPDSSIERTPSLSFMTG